MRHDLPPHAEIGWPFTRAQARETGLADRTISRRIASGAWTVVHPGTYVLAGTSHPQQGLAAAVLAAPHCLVSDQTAARFWDIDLWNSASEPQLISPPNQHIRLDGVAVRRAWVVGEDRDRLLTLGPPAFAWPVTSGLRTVSDLAMRLPQLEAVVAVDSAVRAGLVELTDLRWVAGQRSGLPYSRRLRRCLELADPRAESVLESVARVLLELAGLPRPESQVWIAGYRVDLCYRGARLAIEVDGRAVHDTARAFVADRARQNALVNDGWRVLRFTHDDLRFRPERYVETIRRALSV